MENLLLPSTPLLYANESKHDFIHLHISQTLNVFSYSAFVRPRSVGENIKFYESCNYFGYWGGRRQWNSFCGAKLKTSFESFAFFLLSNSNRQSIHACGGGSLKHVNASPKPHTKLKIIKITKSLIRFMSYSIDMEMEVMSETGEDWLWNIQHQNMHNPN
jgi:hypothetical protein